MRTDISLYLEKKFKKNNLVINSKNLDELFNKFELIYSNLTTEFIKNYKREDILYNHYHNFKKDIIFSNKTLIRINYNNQIIKLNIYHNNEKLDVFINNILFVIYYLIKYSNYTKNIEIDYLLTDLVKEIKNMNIGQIFTQNEINSGLTDFRKNKIIIWRKEEIMKVTIHELIHLLNLGLNQNFTKLIHHYKNKYKISSNYILIDEAYTEFLAVLINNYLITKFSKKTYNYFKYLLKLEINFSIFQSKKILYLSRKNKNDYIDLNKHTQVLSYFIIKLELFMNLDKIVNLININNLNKIEDILINNKKSILNQKIDKKINRKIIKQMRMTLNEYKLF